MGFIFFIAILIITTPTTTSIHYPVKAVDDILLYKHSLFLPSPPPPTTILVTVLYHPSNMQSSTYTNFTHLVMMAVMTNVRQKWQHNGNMPSTGSLYQFPLWLLLLLASAASAYTHTVYNCSQQLRQLFFFVGGWGMNVKTVSYNRKTDTTSTNHPSPLLNVVPQHPLSLVEQPTPIAVRRLEHQCV